MHKIAVLGDRDSIFGFAALGLEIFPAENEKEGAVLLHKLANSDYAVIYITEALASKIGEDVDKYRFSQLPAIILIPGISGNTGEGINAVRRSVEKAVGSDIIFNDK